MGAVLFAAFGNVVLQCRGRFGKTGHVLPLEIAQLGRCLHDDVRGHFRHGFKGIGLVGLCLAEPLDLVLHRQKPVEVAGFLKFRPQGLQIAHVFHWDAVGFGCVVRTEPRNVFSELAAVIRNGGRQLAMRGQ